MLSMSLVRGRDDKKTGQFVDLGEQSEKESGSSAKPAKKVKLYPGHQKSMEEIRFGFGNMHNGQQQHEDVSGKLSR